jgi:BASS family bile acid:Na+ symporter
MFGFGLGLPRALSFGLSAAYLVALNLLLGLEETAPPPRREKYRLLSRTLMFNLTVVPALAFLATRLFDTSSDVAVALLLLSVAPGGPHAPFLARTAGGDVYLATETVIFLAKITVFTAPATARWLLGLKELEIADLPFMAKLMLLQVVPLLIGRQLRRRRPALADRLAPQLGRAVIAIVLTLLILLLHHHRLRTLGLLGDRGWLAVLSLAVAAMALGWLVGGPTVRTRRTMAITANSRNLGLAFVLAAAAYSERAVQLAMFGVWFVLFLFNNAFVWIVGRHTHEPTVPASAH